jgi:replication-associated recombination protein RarA
MIFNNCGFMINVVDVYCRDMFVYCAVAPKSNAVYKAFNQAMSVAKETGDLMPATNEPITLALSVP